MTERLHFHFSLFTFMHWRRKWQPTPVFLPGESQGWGSLVGCCPISVSRAKRAPLRAAASPRRDLEAQNAARPDTPHSAEPECRPHPVSERAAPPPSPAPGG